MNITGMQEKAAVEFYRTKNWERAARFAGYKSTSAASELRCNQNVLERIKQLESEDSLAQYATIPHCTDLLIRAALGQINEVKVGKERFQVKFGSKIRKQINLDRDGNLSSTTITFEHDPLRALELLLRMKGWIGVSEDTEPARSPANIERIIEVARQIASRSKERNSDPSKI